MITNLIELITTSIIEPFQEDTLIVNIVLELVTLFTRDKNDSPLLFGNQVVLEFIFNRLKGPKSFELAKPVVGGVDAPDTNIN
jgi:hypothetical protein